MAPKFKPFSGRAMSDVELAWVAGLLEGEGSFMAIWSHDVARPRVSMQTTDEDVAEKVRALTGMGTIAAVGHRPGKKPCWNWAVARREDALILMATVRPHVSLRRQGQIDHAMVTVATQRRAS